jgi:hypothetical protein
MSKESIEQLIEAEVQKRLAEQPAPEAKRGERILQVGNPVFIRTVTHYYTGRITLIEDDAIVLENAAWIGDTGRFANALAEGTMSEVEPFPGPVEVSRGAIVDVSVWRHALPRNQQ